MRKLEVKDAEIMRIAVQQEILRSEESRYDHRLHGVLLVCSGLSCPEVANLLGHGPRTIQYWVRRFEESGFAGLEETPRPGRPSLIDEDIRNGVAADLRCSPRELGYCQNLWDSKLLSHHLSKQYDIQLGERQCRRFFHQLGFRRRKPRPVIARADQEAQLRYKKT
jgi:transposase